VLISRFQHVIAAANVRLLHMTANRYSLAYTPEADNGRRHVRDGLGLTVNDTWTSQPRKPATLSGGETFQVPLALALGLRDVVTAESGGTQIHTLFIDEGFGTLDDEAFTR
jgi:exonuclease SbcC